MIQKSHFALASKGIRNPKKVYEYLKETSHLYYLNTFQAENAFDREWDILIILDACRVDLLQEVSDGYSFLRDIEQIVSVGSQSEEWMKKTFTSSYSEVLSDTAVVTGNPYSETALDSNKVKTLDEVWKYAWNEDIGSIKANQLRIAPSLSGERQNQTGWLFTICSPIFPVYLNPVYRVGQGSIILEMNPLRSGPVSKIMN